MVTMRVVRNHYPYKCGDLVEMGRLQAWFAHRMGWAKPLGVNPSAMRETR